MSMPPRDPSFPPSRQDYRDLIDHHYVIRGLTFAPLILFPIALKTGAQYGPLSLWTGIGMNLSILLTCLTIPLAIPVMLRDAREAQTRGVDKAIPRRRRWKAAGRVAIAVSFGILSTVHIVPLVQDLASGPKPVTVTSCTSSVADREWRSGRRGSRTTTIRSTRSPCSSQTAPPASKTSACNRRTPNPPTPSRSTTPSTTPVSPIRARHP